MGATLKGLFLAGACALCAASARAQTVAKAAAGASNSRTILIFTEDSGSDSFSPYGPDSERGAPNSAPFRKAGARETMAAPAKKLFRFIPFKGRRRSKRTLGDAKAISLSAKPRSRRTGARPRRWLS